MKIIQVFAALCLAAMPLALSASGEKLVSRYEAPTLLTGTIYEAGSARKHALYKFKRTSTHSGNTVTSTREFTYPDGKLAAREIIVYEGDNLVSYELEELQIGARGTVKLQRDAKSGGTISFDYTTGNNKKSVNTESLKPDTLVGDMIAPFLVAHWDDLMKGEDVKCRYIAADRAETVGFKFVKQSEATLDGRSVVVIKMSPSSFIIAALVDPIYFTLEKDGAHRVFLYEGRTTPKIKDGNKWKDLDAETVFDWN